MVSLEEVAALAQVSPATVSRALSRPDMVAKATRERVMQAAEQLGYQPNELARSLRQKGSRSIGLIVTDILNPFHATLAKGVQDAADRHDRTVFLFNTDEDPEKERRALDSLRGHLPQGLVIVPTARSKENLQLVPNLPVIELDRASGQPLAHTVMVDNQEGARKAVQHLVELGHRRIGMIVGKLDITTALERLQGYKQALSEAGLPYSAELVLPGNHREADGRKAATALLSLPFHQRPTALFVGNNEMTIGAVLAVRELGLQIPHDISIVGFDDSRWAMTMTPAITVVAQPAYDLGFLASETLFSILRRPQQSQPTNLRLSTSFILRNSTAAPRRPQ